MPSPTLPDTLSVDVEDYFHLFIDRPETWDRYQVRVRSATASVLALLREIGARATFFVLGDAARRSPETVRDILEAGHEIASHGYGHQLVHRMSREAFREDLRRGLDTLTAITNRPVLGYRASSFSVTRDTPWFWEVLEEAGIRYSSSLHPVRNFLYGRAPETPLEPFLAPGSGVVEIPVVPARVAGVSVPFSGGFYLRFFPRPVLGLLARRVRAAGRAVHWYLHPWELDLGQPRLPLPPHWRFFRYHRLGRGARVLPGLVADRPLATMGEVMDAVRTHEVA